MYLILPLVGIKTNFVSCNLILLLGKFLISSRFLFPTDQSVVILAKSDVDVDDAM